MPRGLRHEERNYWPEVCGPLLHQRLQGYSFECSVYLLSLHSFSSRVKTWLSRLCTLCAIHQGGGVILHWKLNNPRMEDDQLVSGIIPSRRVEVLAVTPRPANVLPKTGLALVCCTFTWLSSSFSYYTVLSRYPYFPLTSESRVSEIDDVG